MRKTHIKMIAAPLTAAALVIAGVSSAAITPVFPTISNTFAVTGEVIKAADINKLAEAVNNLDQRAWQEGTGYMSAPNAVDGFVVTDDGNVGIGTATPDERLHVSGVFKLSNNATNNFKNPVNDDFRLFIQNDKDGGANSYGIGSNNAIIFENQDYNNSDPDDGLYFFNTGGDSVPEIALSILGIGRVGIGTTAPSTALHVVGTITETSDERLKENIIPVENALEKITQLDGVSFDWKDKEKMDDRTHLGLIAQNVETVFPELVFTEGDEMGTKAVNYDGLASPLIEAIKELKAENDMLKAAFCEEFSEKSICQ